MKAILSSRFAPLAGLALAGLLFAGGSLLSAEAVAADDPCSAKSFDFKAVEAACKEGGRKAVKKLMKEVVKDSRKAGDEKTCLDCHKDLKSFDKTANAVADLKKYLK